MNYPGNNKLTLCPAAMCQVIQEWMNLNHIKGGITVLSVEQERSGCGPNCFEITFTDSEPQEPRS